MLWNLEKLYEDGNPGVSSYSLTLFFFFFFFFGGLHQLLALSGVFGPVNTFWVVFLFQCGHIFWPVLVEVAQHLVCPFPLVLRTFATVVFQSVR